MISFDVLVIWCCVILAFLIRLESFQYLYQSDTYLACMIATGVVVTTFHFRGLYVAFTRYFYFDSVLTITIGCITSAVALILAIYLLNIQIPRSVPLIYGTLFFLMEMGLRLCVRLLSQTSPQQKSTNVAVYGAGATGTQLMNALKWSVKYNVCQFFDDNRDLHGQTIAGIPIDSFNDAGKKLRN